MSYEAVHNAIRRKFDDDVKDVVSGGLPTEYDNAAFTLAAGVTRWARFQVMIDDSDVEELGATQARTYGHGLATVFVSLGRGDTVAQEVVDTIVSAFKQTSTTYGGVTVNFRTPVPRPQGQREGWWQINVTIPFWTDDA